MTTICPGDLQTILCVTTSSQHVARGLVRHAFARFPACAASALEAKNKHEAAASLHCKAMLAALRCTDGTWHRRATPPRGSTMPLASSKCKLTFVRARSSSTASACDSVRDAVAVALPSGTTGLISSCACCWKRAMSSWLASARIQFKWLGFRAKAACA